MAECPPDPERLAAVPPVPDSTTYGAAITACSKGKQWWLALQLLEDMEEKVRVAVPYPTIRIEAHPSIMSGSDCAIWVGRLEHECFRSIYS